eukprot:3020741-Pyramimonas_sp.AAC.1
MCGPIGARKVPFTNARLKTCLRGLGCKVAVDEGGLRCALRDGNRFLEPFGKAPEYVQTPCSGATPMKYVAHVCDNHFIAVISFDDGLGVIDGEE